MEQIDPHYLLRPKERTLDGVCQYLDEAQKELKKIQSKKNVTQEEIDEKMHRVKILQLKKAKYERMRDDKKSRLSATALHDSRKDSTFLTIERINEEFDEKTSGNILSDAIGLLGDSLDLNSFLSFFNEDESSSTVDTNSHMIALVTNQLEQAFKFGDELLAKEIVEHAMKKTDMDVNDLGKFLRELSPGYKFSKEFIESTFEIISKEKAKEFKPEEQEAQLQQSKEGMEKLILKISLEAEDKDRDSKTMAAVIEAVGIWGKILEVTSEVANHLLLNSMTSELDELISRKKKLGKHVANLFSTISYIRASVGSWNMENATASLDEAIKSVWKVTSILIEGNFASLRGLKEAEGASKQPLTPQGHENSSKLAKFFGATPPETKHEPMEHLIADAAFSTTLFFTMEGNIKGGTLEKLVERLTHHSIRDHEFVFAFLLTYRSFTNASTVLNLLIQRFKIEFPEGLTQAEQAYYLTHKLQPIRERVLDVIKSWIELDSDLFISDMDLRATLIEFTLTTVKTTIPQAYTQIDGILNGTLVKYITLRKEEKPPNPIMPKSLRHLAIGSLDPTEAARQLTLIDFEIFKRINPKEFFKLAWSKKESATLAPNITAFIKRSTQLTSFVCSKILEETDIKLRAEILKHFILIADRCRNLGNYNTLMAIHGGLQSSSIHRLQRTWRLLGKRELQLLDEMKELMSYRRNFREYRAALKQAKPPCIPFLGLYLTDLTFIEDGNKDYLATGEFINFDKRMRTARVIQEILNFQSKPYNFQVVPQIEEYLRDIGHYEKDEEEFYEISQMVEKKENDGELLTRVLSDSGFA